MKKLFLLLLTFSVEALSAQVSADSAYTFRYIDRSTRFAWLTYGADLLSLSGGSANVLSPSNALTKTDFGVNVMPRLSIGGAHFGGHADFYVTFPLSFLTIQPSMRFL